MIISHHHKFIFIHIPRTGGVSTQTALSSYYDAHPLAHVDPRYQGYHYHSTLQEYQDSLKTYFKWTRVTNPWDRLVSIYNRRRSNSEFARDYKRAAEEAIHNSFDNWVDLQIAQKSEWALNQRRYIKDQNIDFISRFESIDKDFSFFCSKVGLPEIKLPHIKGHPHVCYKEYYHDKLIDKLLNCATFREDLNYLSYDHQP